MNTPSLTVYILCHKYLKLARRGIWSVEHQLDPGFEVGVNLMVNTNDLMFLEEAKNTHEGTVLHSWSNGMPGAGKNACIRDWRTNEQTDYMMIIDGDDWLYPYALWHLKQVITRMPEVDFVGLQTHDMVAPFKSENSAKIRGGDEPLYLTSWNKQQHNMQVVSPRSTWIKKLVGYHTIDRIMLMKRSGFFIDGWVREYPEDMACYEDMVFDVNLFYAMKRDFCNYLHISSSGIYLYDSGAAGMVSETLKNRDHQAPYEYHIRKLVDCYGVQDFSQVPFMAIKNHKTVNMLGKIEYINRTYGLFQ